MRISDELRFKVSEVKMKANKHGLTTYAGDKCIHRTSGVLYEATAQKNGKATGPA